MDHSRRVRLVPEDLAATGTTLQGRIDAAEFSARVAAALCVPVASGAIDYRLSFSPAEQGGVAISGTLQAQLEACCQRCLERLSLEFDVPVRLLIPASEGVEPEPGWDAAEAGARPSLVELIEEELLLALPIVPRHPDGACAAARAESSPETESRGTPFEGLAKLTRRSRD